MTAVRTTIRSVCVSLYVCVCVCLGVITNNSYFCGKNTVTDTPDVQIRLGMAFESGLVGIGGYVVTFGLIIFAFTTILGWSYYGERCAEYIFGVKAMLPYRLLWLIAIPVGAMGKLTLIWSIADVMNGLMAIPNLIALVLLSPVIFSVTRSYFSK